MSTIQDRISELFSALQKSVRRGLEEDALFFALDLEEINKKALWNRLKVIASEDIGLANPLMSCLIETLEKQYLNEGLDNSRFLFLAHAVLALCRSPKNRTVDDFLNVVKIERERGKPLVIPAYAYDMHTRKGRLNGMGWKEFFEEGSKLENESGSNPYRERHRKLRNV